MIRHCRPLIRIIAERYPPPVKAAILSTLTILLTRVPQYVKPFFPQLQRTFVKNLSDLTSSSIRLRAATGLGALMAHQPRIDPLITELINGSSHDEQDIREAMVNALGLVVQSGGANIGPAARDALADFLRISVEEPGRDNYNAAVARIVAGAVLHEMPQAATVVTSIVEGKANPLTSAAILQCLETAPEQFYRHDSARIVNRVLKNVINEHTGIARPAREARDLFKKTAPWSGDEEVQSRVA